MIFGQDLVPVVKKLFGKVKRICEFGAGPGFIGFSLLANDLCESLCLIEVNPDAIEACIQTVKENDLASKTSVYRSWGLRQVPRNERWDLVVSNPPHFRGSPQEYAMDLINIDPHWGIHKEFYKEVPNFLPVGGSVLFLENLKGSTPRLWRQMIEASYLEFVKCFRYRPNPLGVKARVRNPDILTDYSSFGHTALAYRLRKARRQGLRFERVFSYAMNAGRYILDPAWREIDSYPYYFVWSRRKDTSQAD